MSEDQKRLACMKFALVCCVAAGAIAVHDYVNAPSVGGWTLADAAAMDVHFTHQEWWIYAVVSIVCLYLYGRLQRNSLR